MLKRLLLVTWASLFTLTMTVALADEASSKSLPTVAVITTGGTIAEKTDPKTGGAVPAVSGEKGYLGYVFGDQVIRINERVGRIRIPLPKKLPKQLPKVPLIAMYAGADGSLVRAAVDGGAQGLVVEGVGSGNVNAEVNEAIQYALAKKIPVVITTRVYNGAVEPVYGDKGGGRALMNEGAILGGALISPKARLLLIIALLEHGDDLKAIRRVFSQVRGAPR